MPEGTPLRTIRDGIVEEVTHDKDNIGNGVLVRWEDGKVSIYDHMSKTTVNVGDKVHAGDLLSYSGNSGHVVGVNGGYHLHIGLKEGGRFIDPSPYVNDIQNMNVKQYVQHAPE
ncbi:M23 family metallopeptidase [Bacillus sp. ISL-46]|nr:M23 family metallopeptidase [Bacillus sp. ISL-46]